MTEHKEQHTMPTRCTDTRSEIHDEDEPAFPIIKALPSCMQWYFKSKTLYILKRTLSSACTGQTLCHVEWHHLCTSRPEVTGRGESKEIRRWPTHPSIIVCNAYLS
eukprot:scpid111610/ scgid19572/ 